MLESVAGHYGFDIDAAFEDLPEAIRQVLLHGSGPRRSRSSTKAEGARGKQRRLKRKHPFEGILPNLERRYRETDSTAVREDLMRYQSAKPCPDCHGTRLRPEARHVFLVDVDGAGAERREPIFRSSTSPCGPRSTTSRASRCTARRPASPTRSCARSARGCAS
jgi:excinuclease ABC subunit A